MPRYSTIPEEAVDLAVELLARRAHPFAIKSAMREKYAITSARALRRLLQRAHKKILRGIDRPVEELIAEAVGFYEAAIRSRDSDLKMKLQARERLDKLLGLDTAIKQDRAHPLSEPENIDPAFK